MPSMKTPLITPDLDDLLKRKKADESLKRAEDIFKKSPAKKMEELKPIPKANLQPKKEIKPKKFQSWEEKNKARKEAEEEVGIERGKKKKDMTNDEKKVISNKALKSLKEKFGWEPDEKQFNAVYKKG